MFALFATAVVLVQGARLDSLLLELESLLEAKVARGADTQCTPKYTVPKCGKCMESVQCLLADVTATTGPMKGYQSAYCCPRLKVCLQGPRDSCPQPVAMCEPKCFKPSGAGCTCEHADFPNNWAAQTCPNGYTPPAIAPTNKPISVPPPTNKPVSVSGSGGGSGSGLCTSADAKVCVATCGYCLDANQADKACYEQGCSCLNTFAACVQEAADCSSKEGSACVGSCGYCLDKKLQNADCFEQTCSCLNRFADCAAENLAAGGASGSGNGGGSGSVVADCTSANAKVCTATCGYCLDENQADKACFEQGCSCLNTFAACVMDAADCTSKEANACVGSCGYCLDKKLANDACYEQTCSCLNRFAECAAENLAAGGASGSGNGGASASGDVCATPEAATCVDSCAFCLGCQGAECEACMKAPCNACGDFIQCFPPKSDCSSADAKVCLANCGKCVDPAQCPEGSCPECYEKSCSCLNTFVDCAFAAL